MLDDGTPPPPNIMIERVCNGAPRPETYADSRGRFSFEVGGMRRGFVPDASYSGSGGQLGIGASPNADSMTGLGSSSRNSLLGCELRASLPGFRSDTVSLSGLGIFDGDVGTIVLRRIAEVNGYTISVTTSIAPKKARKAYQNGLNRARNEKWDKAEIQLRQAVEEYPRYAVAWQALGQVLEAQQRHTEAREAYDKALEADGSYLSPHLRIALLAARDRNWQEMAAVSDQVISLNPYDFPEAYYYSSVARLNLQDLAGAERSARDAIERNVEERYPQVESVLGAVLVRQGAYVEASEHLRRYLELSPDAEDAELIRRQIGQLDQHLKDHPQQ